MSHSGGEFSYQSHFFRLQEGFPALFKFRLGLIHILNQAAHTVTERFDFIAGGVECSPFCRLQRSAGEPG